MTSLHTITIDDYLLYKTKMDEKVEDYLAWVENHLKEQKEWSKILAKSQDDPALREAIERVKIMYYLGEQDGTK